nr:ABC transporter permease [Frigidibacter sp. ROC022]
MLAVVLTALFAGWLSPYPPTEQDLLARLTPPVFAGGTWAHPLGTDTLGRDILSRLFHGMRVSLSLALAGTVIGAALGTLLGFLAAAIGGIFEDVVMALVDFQASLPFLIIALAVLAFLGSSLTLFVMLMGLYGWETYARLSRGMVLSAQERDHIAAIRSLGAKPLRVYLRHIFPNIAPVLIVQLTLNFPEIILAETSLSFLGLGLQPPHTSLGMMLGDGRDYLIVAWWIAVLPGMTIFLTTLSISILGDWVRDRLDPKLAD